MVESELVQKLREQLQRCAGFEGDDVAKAREQALDYYFQRPRGDEIAGRSAVVSGDLSAMVEANLAQMLDAFSGDEIIEFQPTGPEDEDQAELESYAVTDLVMGQNNGYMTFATAIKDALLQRNGICKVWVEETSEARTERYSNVTPEALAELTNRPGVDCKVRKFQDGELTLRCTYTRRRFQVAPLPPENFLYTQDWDRLDLQEIPFCAERHLDPRSKLVELGFPADKVRQIPKHQQRTNSTDGAARNPRKRPADQVGIDESQELVEWFECFVLMDSDGDGISERRRVALAHTFILENEPANLVPFAAGTAIINPHRFLGISLFDKLKQQQDTSTGLMRALMDNVRTTTKNRIAYLDGRVNVDDVGDGRPDGAIRVKNVDDVARAIMPFVVPDTSANILANLQDQRQIRSELGGAAPELATGQMQLGDRVGSEGVDRAYSVMEQLAAMMTRIVAASLIRSVFLLAHATLREYYSTPVELKIRGKWQSPIPAQWPERRRLTVKVGMSPGERSRRANALMQILRSQVELAGAGMDEVLVNLDGFYRVLMDWARTVEIRNPEQYFRDPQSPESQQALKSKQSAQQEQDQQKRMLMQQAISLEQIGKALEKYRHDSKLEFEYFREILGAEKAEAEIAGKAAAELLKAQGASDGSKETGAGAREQSAVAGDSRGPRRGAA
jgi:hypothetical protein